MPSSGANAVEDYDFVASAKKVSERRDYIW